MTENNYKQAACLIEEAEEISKLPVRVVWDSSLQVGAVLHLSEASWTKQLRISVNPNRPDIPYLVASQCAVAIRFFQQNENKHLVSKTGDIEKTINEFIDLGYSPQEAKAYTEHLVPGLGQQLRGTPTQILISTWLHREYPELHESQLTYCTREVESSYSSLAMDKNKYPTWLIKSHQAINGAVALATDYLFDRNDLFKPFKDNGFEEICTGLVGDITANTQDTSDVQLVSLWLNRLNLSEHFDWKIV